MSKLSNISNANSNKPFESSNSIQRELSESLLDYLKSNLFYSEKQNKNEFWQQLRSKNDTIVVKHSHFKGYYKILYYLDILSPAEIEKTFRLTIRQFSKSNMEDRNFVFQDK
ncbi:hypothetical protein NMY3_01226 [Candidatus Nitrosocosmicus oleophilus]|uniref:Uncharacterized protein n=1 Tax=Candidatus Nitrosocosmicus oleophilus TaxID=1353260 RepID=A0A654LYT2_9ARCH|nr:hypothetical protein [Candidatus Nitrosocosmicus oleophilus]ALI35431.1 hypothetical protein NMY3_01226 [Candidatus Nitrosocosmicus oleophilus]